MAPADDRAPSRPPGTYRLGSIGGVDVHVRPSWLVFAALIAVLLAPSVDRVEPGLGPLKYVAGVAFAVLLYLSILLHEVAHAMMARHYGLPVRSISLQFLGGMTEMDGEPRTAGQEFMIAVVGPLTSIAVGVAALGAQLIVPDGLVRLAFQGLASANILVGVLNLVPGLPLDGGRVLRAAVWSITGNMHMGTMVAGWGGRLVALAVLAWPALAHLAWDLRPTVLHYAMACLLAGYLWAGATSSMTSARIRRRLPSLKARPLARRVAVVYRGLTVAEAVRVAQEKGAGGIVLRDGDRLTGIVSEAALTATPEARRPQMTIDSIARTMEPGLTLPADIAGEELVLAMARYPASEYVLTEADGTVYGLLATADVDAAFSAGGHR